MTFFCIRCLLTLLSLAVCSNGDFPLAILHLQGVNRFADTCVEYNPLYSKPHAQQNAQMYPIILVPAEEACKEQSPWYTPSAFFITPRGNCSFFYKLKQADKSHAKQVILITDNDKNSDEFPKGTANEHKEVHATITKIDAATWNSIIKEIGIPIYSKVYVASKLLLDPSIVCLWVIAVFTVVAGCYWSGRVRRQMNDSELLREDDQSNFEDDPIFPKFSPVFILVFIAMLSCVLLLIYYFYKYLIYLVIAVFAIATAQGLYMCLWAIASSSKCAGCRVPENKIPLLKSRPRVLSIILFVFCIALSVFWVIIRNDDYSWILQDFLGACLCISFLRHFYLPDLKIGVILLAVMLLYDVFFVFITPLFSARGPSVMTSVAKGEGQTEAMPMVIRMPKMIVTDMWLCEVPYSLLGLGDILLPGVFVSFCHNFDVIARTKYPVYFITSSVAYAFGLFMAFLVLVLTSTAQPALLYLSPSLLVAVVITGSYRRELEQLWKGEFYSDKA